MRRILFAFGVSPWVVWAALRVGWNFRRLPLDACVAKLRDTTFSLPAGLQNPRYLRGMVNRILPLLPPRKAGRCLRRSLVLLDLLSRCGLRPVFYMGIRPGSGKPDGHAWLVAEGYEPTPGDTEYTEIVSL